MAELGASRIQDIAPEHLANLNAGTAQARTLTEALAIDHPTLLRAALPDAGPALTAATDEAQRLGILKRIATIGGAVHTHLDAAQRARLATHSSDTVRGWACFAVGAQSLRHLSSAAAVAELLTQIRPFADDPHFTVREWAWMAIRNPLVARLPEAITALSSWTSEPSPRVRRFASEALRPRGVSAARTSQHSRPRPSSGIHFLSRCGPTRIAVCKTPWRTGSMTLQRPGPSGRGISRPAGSHRARKSRPSASWPAGCAQSADGGLRGSSAGLVIGCKRPHAARSQVNDLRSQQRVRGPLFQTYLPSRSNFCCCVPTGLKIRKYGAASAPQPATHCQLNGLLAASASTSVSQNHASPTRQSMRRFFVRNDAVTIRTRLCINPDCHSSRIPASTSGKPVSALPSLEFSAGVQCATGTHRIAR